MPAAPSSFPQFLPLNCPRCRKIIFGRHPFPVNYSDQNQAALFVDISDEKEGAGHPCYTGDVAAFTERLQKAGTIEKLGLIFNGPPEKIAGDIRRFCRTEPGQPMNNYLGFGLLLGPVADTPEAAPDGPWRYAVMKTDGRQITAESKLPSDILPGTFVEFIELKRSGLQKIKCTGFRPLQILSAEPLPGQVYRVEMRSGFADILQHRIDQFCREISWRSGRLINVYPLEINRVFGREMFGVMIRFSLADSVKSVLEQPFFSKHVTISISQENREG